MPSSSHNRPRLVRDEASPEDHARVLDQIRGSLLPPLPLPVDALQLLLETAQTDSGGGQAARNFLFWLAGRPDPSGYRGSGGLELRRLDAERRNAAMEILRWWCGGIESDEPLYAVLAQLRERFPPVETRDLENA